MKNSRFCYSSNDSHAFREAIHTNSTKRFITEKKKGISLLPDKEDTLRKPRSMRLYEVIKKSVIKE